MRREGNEGKNDVTFENQIISTWNDSDFQDPILTFYCSSSCCSSVDDDDKHDPSTEFQTVRGIRASGVAEAYFLFFSNMANNTISIQPSKTRLFPRINHRVMQNPIAWRAAISIKFRFEDDRVLFRSGTWDEMREKRKTCNIIQGSFPLSNLIQPIRKWTRQIDDEKLILKFLQSKSIRFLIVNLIFIKASSYIKRRIPTIQFWVFFKFRASLGLGYIVTCGAIKCHLKYVSCLPLAKKVGKSSNGRHETYFKWHLMAPHVLM